MDYKEVEVTQNGKFVAKRNFSLELLDWMHSPENIGSEVSVHANGNVFMSCPSKAMGVPTRDDVFDIDGVQVRYRLFVSVGTIEVLKGQSTEGDRLMDFFAGKDSW